MLNTESHSASRLKQRKKAIAAGLNPDRNFGGLGVSIDRFSLRNDCPVCGGQRIWKDYYTPVDCTIRCATCEPPPEEFASDVYEVPRGSDEWPDFEELERSMAKAQFSMQLVGDDLIAL